MRRREFIAGLGGAALVVVYFILGMLHESYIHSILTLTAPTGPSRISSICSPRLDAATA